MHSWVRITREDSPIFCATQGGGGGCGPFRQGSIGGGQGSAGGGWGSFGTGCGSTDHGWSAIVNRSQGPVGSDRDSGIADRGPSALSLLDNLQPAEAGHQHHGDQGQQRVGPSEGDAGRRMGESSKGATSQTRNQPLIGGWGGSAIKESRGASQGSTSGDRASAVAQPSAAGTSNAHNMSPAGTPAGISFGKSPISAGSPASWTALDISEIQRRGESIQDFERSVLYTPLTPNQTPRRGAGGRLPRSLSLGSPLEPGQIVDSPASASPKECCRCCILCCRTNKCEGEHLIPNRRMSCRAPPPPPSKRPLGSVNSLALDKEGMPKGATLENVTKLPGGEATHEEYWYGKALQGHLEAALRQVQREFGGRNTVMNRIQDTIVNMISETIQMADEMTHQHQIESTYAIDAGLRQMTQMHSERAKVCARCTGVHGCKASNCTNACFRCAASKGHETGCLMAASCVEYFPALSESAQSTYINVAEHPMYAGKPLFQY